MKKLVFIVLLFTSMFVHAKNTVTEYQRIYVPVFASGAQPLIAIREFKMNGTPSFLVVNPNTLKTAVFPIKVLAARPLQAKRRYFQQRDLANTLYVKLLNKYTSPPYPLENKGLKHIAHIKKGNILTIDLCPSSKPFEKEFFQQLAAIADKTKQPTPITIAISGMWIIQHAEEFQWLLNQQKENKLDITWANHSFSHVYYADQPYRVNFLLSQNTNLDAEILLTEQYLLEAGEMPSVFFRFPGLVSNRKILKQLKTYGLIPLGADAWLAKHQIVTPGGIILVHGNSNEPEGIEAILGMLKNLNLLDIRQALQESTGLKSTGPQTISVRISPLAL